MAQIGNYKITKKIEEGGMAVVYQGIQESLGRPVAIKVLKHKFIKETLVVNYFNRESLIIARLIHPNIIHVIDRGLTDNGMPYFVMDFIKGTDTARLIMKGGLKFNRKLDIVVQTCKALAYAHKNGVIHRDIKPANILIDTEGNAVVTDFGIAQFYQRGKETQQNKKKELLGTPTYMSPEQKINSSEVTFASDIYSLGVVMFELFTEKRFPKKLQRPSEIAPDIPAPLERIILQCLSPDPERRPASVDAITSRLFDLFQGAHISSEQKTKALSGVPDMNDIFTILDIIKDSETGSVYLLRHNQSGNLMVAKTFKTMNSGIKTARVLLSLKHDNIVDIQGVSASDSGYIIVMEYLSGGNLADRMVMPHPWQESLYLILRVCKGLLFAHQNRMAHGNLRPSNILFTESEGVKLTDFGMGADSKGLQEQIQADILSTGAILYKMILGFGPVLKGDSFVPHKQFKTLPDNVKRLIFRFLTQKTNLRFQSMKQVIDEIERINEEVYEVEATAVALDEDLSESTQKTLDPAPETAPPKKAETAKHKRRKMPLTIRFMLFIFFVISAAALMHEYAPDEFRKILNVIIQKAEWLRQTYFSNLF